MCMYIPGYVVVPSSVEINLRVTTGFKRGSIEQLNFSVLLYSSFVKTGWISNSELENINCKFM